MSSTLLHNPLLEVMSTRHLDRSERQRIQEEVRVLRLLAGADGVCESAAWSVPKTKDCVRL